MLRLGRTLAEELEEDVEVLVEEEEVEGDDEVVTKRLFDGKDAFVVTHTRRKEGN